MIGYARKSIIFLGEHYLVGGQFLLLQLFSKAWNWLKSSIFCIYIIIY